MRKFENDNHMEPLRRLFHFSSIYKFSYLQISKITFALMAYRIKSGEMSYLRRRSRSNFVTAIFSIALVLFFLGTFATLALFTKSFHPICQRIY